MSGQPTVPIAADAIFADISDGDFRTYSIICQQAWRTAPEAEKPYIELTHAQIADLHPGAKKPAVNTIRVRIQRLVAEGLLTRERVSNTRWRTRPTITMNVPISPQIIVKNGPETVQMDDRPAISHDANLHVGDRSAIGQTTLGDLPTITQNQVSDLPAITQQKSGSLGDHSPITQAGDNSMPDPSAITQNHESASWVIAQRALTAQNSGLGDRPTRGQPLDTDLTDLTDLDLDHDHKKQQQTDQIKQVDPKHEQLAAQLAALRPEAMSAEGIAECLTQPALTAAWLTYVIDPANGVRKPAGYLRRQVRNGHFPETKPTLLWNHGESHADARHHQPQPDPHASVAVAAPQATRWPLDVG